MAVLIAYGWVAAVWFGVASLFFVMRDESDRSSRRNAARMALLAPVWPTIIIVWFHILFIAAFGKDPDEETTAVEAES